MNIFWLDSDIEKSVQYYCDKHVVKMCLEYAQILSTTSRLHSLDQGYNITHSNHPCVRWAEESSFNWLLLYQLELSLGEEFKFRFYKSHKSVELVKTFKLPKLPLTLPTSPPLCMPDIYKEDDLIQSYRKYYIGDKQHISNWTRRPVPFWYILNRR